MGVHQSDHPLIRHKLTLLRDASTDSKQFRELTRDISLLLTYEATADLKLDRVTVTTPLAQACGHHLKEAIGLVPVLRAGLGMVEGILGMVPTAQVWHVGLYRDHRTLRPVPYYSNLPACCTVQLCLVLDPMLATGGTAVATVDLLKEWGAERVKVVAIIAALEGIRRLQEAHSDVDIHVAATDDRLTHPPTKPGDPPEGYIVPGLGDAGDRQFGTG